MATTVSNTNDVDPASPENSEVHNDSDDDVEIPDFTNDPNWSDIIPIPQDEGEYMVVKIAYSETFRITHDYLRALMQANEISDRALDLTEYALQLNSANYTTWHYRRNIVQGLNSDLQKELLFTARIINKNPKNYQVWYHRQKITEWLKSPGDELAYTAKCLREDSKNYHVWQYRQWLVETYPEFCTKELNYTHQLLEEDFRNNSAWNQRYFVLFKLGVLSSEQSVLNETEFVKKLIRLSLQNESAWNYLRGILVGHSLKVWLSVKEWCLELISEVEPTDKALSFLLETCELQLEEGGHENAAEVLQEALNYCSKLETELDVIRKHYWKHTAERLKDLCKQLHGVSDV